MDMENETIRGRARSSDEEEEEQTDAATAAGHAAAAKSCSSRCCCCRRVSLSSFSKKCIQRFDLPLSGPTKRSPLFRRSRSRGAPVGELQRLRGMPRRVASRRARAQSPSLR